MSADQPTRPGQRSDPAMFAPLTTDQNRILHTRLTSAWYRQHALYPALSEPWQETGGLLHDLGKASDAAFEAEHPASKDAELAEPEAGA